MPTTSYVDKQGVKHYGVMARCVQEREQREQRKILYSPGFGAGWSSWCHGEREEVIFMLTFKPLIEAIETGEPIGWIGYPVKDRKLLDAENLDTLAYYRAHCAPGSPLDQFVVAFAERFGTDDIPHLSGARDLIIAIVDQPFRVTEYDGSESVEHLNPAAFISPTDLP